MRVVEYGTSTAHRGRAVAIAALVFATGGLAQSFDSTNYEYAITKSLPPPLDDVGCFTLLLALSLMGVVLAASQLILTRRSGANGYRWVAVLALILGVVALVIRVPLILTVLTWRFSPPISD